ncbi:hypothetical protein [Nocardioides sp. KR10-350]|uniref:HNH endonuclease signature motif containing protein n=1 Tax=Nocardioides cheoyonin TaxID=3156615 RepID=UPI0032B33985
MANLPGTHHDPADPAAVLAAVAGSRAEENRAAAETLALVADYAAMHALDATDADSARQPAVEKTGSDLAGDRGLPLAGEGAPLVSEFAVVELGPVLGVSAMSARKLVGDVLELRHRLPATWARVLDYTLPAWKARRIAEHTKHLTAQAAAWVDAQVAPTAERWSWAGLGRLAEEAMAAFDPETAALEAEEKTSEHHATIETRPVAGETGIGGHALLEATLDLADAADLESAVAAIANGLLTDPDHPEWATWALDRRRAKALGILARHYTGGQAGGTAKVLHLYCHLDKGALAGTGLVRVDNFSAVVPIERIHEWATTPGTVIKPVQVIDLNAVIDREGYTPSQAQHVQAALICETCAFPHCHRPAWHTDTDHIDPYRADQTGSRTESRNLAKLCRLHHRAKTHDGWTYRQLSPGVFLWTSPHGFQYLRHQGGGTTELHPGESPPAATG